MINKNQVKSQLSYMKNIKTLVVGIFSEHLSVDCNSLNCHKLVLFCHKRTRYIFFDSSFLCFSINGKSQSLLFFSCSSYMCNCTMHTIDQEFFAL